MIKVFRLREGQPNFSETNIVEIKQAFPFSTEGWKHVGRLALVGVTPRLIILETEDESSNKWHAVFANILLNHHTTYRALPNLDGTIFHVGEVSYYEEPSA